MWFASRTYQSLPQTERLSDGPESMHKHEVWCGLKPRSITMGLVLTNIVTLLALFVSLFFKEKPSNLACIEKFSTPSPALKAVEYLEPSHYNADFRQTNVFRAAPGTHSDDVDLAWYHIELGAGGIRLTEEEVLALNVSMETIHHPERPLHKVPEEHGGGYLAMLEVFHLLHCLNTLRMGLFYNYDKYYKHLDEGVHEENIFTHYDHCIDMLRLQLMCTADVTPALFYDPLNNPLRRDGLPNWSSQHTCRNFDAILDWNKNGPRAIRWRDAGSNPVWDPSLEGADPPFPPEQKDVEEEDHHHHG